MCWQVVNGDKNTVKAQQGVDILAGQAVGHGNGYNGSGNGDNNHNNQQYVTGNNNTVIGTVYTSNNGVCCSGPALCTRASRGLVPLRSTTKLGRSECEAPFAGHCLAGKPGVGHRQHPAGGRERVAGGG